MADKTDSTIYYMIGLPGSGKSRVAENKSKELDIPVLSSDNMRKKMSGNEGDVETCSHQEIFKKLREEANERIEGERGFVWDATGINARFRREDIDMFKKKGAKIIALVMTTPREVCLERNKKRDRNVPEEIIEEMDRESKLMENIINTELDLFDEVRFIDKDGEETDVYERESKKGEGTISREAEIIPELKIK